MTIPDSSAEECEKVESVSAFECGTLISFVPSRWRAIGFVCTIDMSSLSLNMFDREADGDSSIWLSSSNASSRRAVGFASTVDTPCEVSLSLGTLKD